MQFYRTAFEKGRFFEIGCRFCAAFYVLRSSAFGAVRHRAFYYLKASKYREFDRLYIYTREKTTGFDRRFLMKRVGDSWMIDGVQERLDGWQRTGL